MKHTIEQQAKEFAEKCHDANMRAGFFYRYDVLDMINAFKEGVNWQMKQSPWINVKERLPEEHENIIIMCKHGAIFNGTYINDVWFCMGGYLYDTCEGNTISSSMCGIPPLWKPIAWMPTPKFNE